MMDRSESIDTIMLFFLIIFLSVFLWFLLGATNSNQSSEPGAKNNTRPSIVNPEPEIPENLILEEAIQDLKWNGCQLLYITPKVYLDNPHYLDYEEFKSKALENKLVIITPSNNGTILLIQIKNDQWIWIPS